MDPAPSVDGMAGLFGCDDLIRHWPGKTTGFDAYRSTLIPTGGS